MKKENGYNKEIFSISWILASADTPAVLSTHKIVTKHKSLPWMYWFAKEALCFKFSISAATYKSLPRRLTFLFKMSIARLISSSCWNSLKYNEHSLILLNLLNAKIRLITAPEQTSYCSGDPWSPPLQRDNLNVAILQQVDGDSCGLGYICFCSICPW